MKPYYDYDGITIYHGDCREILPELRADLVCTDPPYNCGKDYGVWNDSLPKEEYQRIMTEIASMCLACSPNQAWVAPRYQLTFWLSVLQGSHLIVIERGAQGPIRAGWGDQFEIALAIGRPSDLISDLWKGIRLKGEGYFFRENTFDHPGYTPEPIMRRFVKHLSKSTVIDPFCGTGTTLSVCKSMGRLGIGIEINERYCEIAARRIEAARLTLLDPLSEQEVLLFS